MHAYVLRIKQTIDYYQVKIVIGSTNMELITRLEDLQSQLDDSWPKMLQKTLDEFPHGDDDFWIYTFTKWDYHQNPPKFHINHCPIKICPYSWALPGTTMRLISPKGGFVKIIWTLPEEHAFHLYESGKFFSDSIVHESIRKYKSGEFARLAEEKYEKV